jgi:hypothetical protein
MFAMPGRSVLRIQFPRRGPAAKAHCKHVAAARNAVWTRTPEVSIVSVAVMMAIAMAMSRHLTAMRCVTQQHVHRACSTISSSCRTKRKDFCAQPQPAIHLCLEDWRGAPGAESLAGDQADTSILPMRAFAQKARERQARIVNAKAVQVEFIIDGDLPAAQLAPYALRHAGTTELLAFTETRRIFEYAIRH